MGKRKQRVCRMCLSSTAVLRSIFTIFMDHNLVFIIRDVVRLDIDEHDHLPKVICKSCAVKLIRVREHVSLFTKSDRQLRERVRCRTRADTTEEEVAPGASNDEKTIQFNEVKLEPTFSEDEDVPLYRYMVAPIPKDEPGPIPAISEDEPKTCPLVKNERCEGDKEQPESSSEENGPDAFEVPSGRETTPDECVETNIPRRSTRRVKTEAKTKGTEPDEDCHQLDDERTDETYKLEPGKDNSRNELNRDSEEDSSSSDRPATPVRRRTTVRQAKSRKRHSGKSKTKPDGAPMLHDFKCYICNSDSLGSRKAMIEHFATHVGNVPYTCKECVMETVVLTRVRTLNTHLKMHAQPIKCDYCDRRYSNAAGKYYHTQTFHLGGGAPCLVNCNECGKQCGSAIALKQHMKYHTTKLKCSKCDLVFNHPNKKRNHERTHDENQGYECVVCKKVLQTIESYDVHLKKHSQERSYQCTLCPKKFNTSCNLILHLKVHAKNDNYKPARSWIEHYTVLNRNPMHYKCNHCDRYNTDKVNNMISHLQAHFKEYECSYCQHKFATAKQLRAHTTTHTGDKPEMCKLCMKVFSTKNNLRIHLKSHTEPATPHEPVIEPQQQQQQQQMVPHVTSPPTASTVPASEQPYETGSLENFAMFPQEQQHGTVQHHAPGGHPPVSHASTVNILGS